MGWRIRGARSREVARLRKRYVNEWSSFAIQIELTLKTGKAIYYIDVGYHEIQGYSLASEFLSTEAGFLFATKESEDPRSISLLLGESGEELTGINRLQPALIQFNQHLAGGQLQLSDNEQSRPPFDYLQLINTFLQYIPSDLVPDRMREPGFPGMPMIGAVWAKSTRST